MRFAPKSVEKIQLAHENYILRKFMIKTDLNQILRLSCQKVHFASNLKKE